MEPTNNNKIKDLENGAFDAAFAGIMCEGRPALACDRSAVLCWSRGRWPGMVKQAQYFHQPAASRVCSYSFSGSLSIMVDKTVCVISVGAFFSHSTPLSLLFMCFWWQSNVRHFGK